MLGGSQALSQSGLDDMARAAILSGENNNEQNDAASRDALDSRPRDTSDAQDLKKEEPKRDSDDEMINV